MPVRRYRPDSLFGPGPRRRLDREQRARFKFLLNAHARAGRLPAKQKWVGGALLKRLGDDGQCDPSHDTLAADAAVSVRTVKRATVTMRGLGLLRWQHRIVRAGWRTEQTSNAYTLSLTENPPPRCECQSGRRTVRVLLSTTEPPADRVEALAAMAARQAVMQERLLKRYAASGGIGLNQGRRADDANT
jgi:hypothetical protein